MFLTETEIMTQHEALEKSYAYLIEKENEIQDFFSHATEKKFNFFGCGSSYMLAKSAQRMFASIEGISANAIAGGDYLVNPEFFQNMIEDSIVVAISRSGKTTEIVRDLKYIKEHTNAKVISITLLDHNDFSTFADLDLIMGWCYDKSVCQTRSVTNLYLAISMMYAMKVKDTTLLNELKTAIDLNQDYKETYRPLLKEIAEKPWDNAVVLADGPLAGLAEEGSLAFAEIAMISGRFQNALDYRHGPIVLNNEKTVTIILIQPGNNELQKDMVEDVKKHKGIVITVSDQEGNPYDAALHVSIGNIHTYIAMGIPFINVMQMLSYEKALVCGTNPDEPVGLDAYIVLK